MLCDNQLTNSIKTGSSDTRSKRQNSLELNPHLEVAVDWIRVKTKHCHLKDYHHMLEFLAGKFSDTWDVRPDQPMSLGKGAQRYPNVAYSVKGMRSGWIVNKDGDVGGCIEIPGNVLSQTFVQMVWIVCQHIDKRWYDKCTRFDIALDDYSNRFSPDDLEAALRVGNVVGCEDYRVAGEGKIGKALTRTVYAGSRESEKMLRCYKKEDFTRFEGEFKRRQAEEIWKAFVSLAPGDGFRDLMSQFLGGLVVGMFDFVDRSTGQRADRCKRLEFWQTLRDEVKCAIKLSPSRAKSSVEKIRGWWNKQIVKSMAVIRRVMGLSRFYFWMNRQFDEAEKEFKSNHYALMEQAGFEFAIGLNAGFTVDNLM